MEVEIQETEARVGVPIRETQYTRVEATTKIETNETSKKRESRKKLLHREMGVHVQKEEEKWLSST